MEGRTFRCPVCSHADNAPDVPAGTPFACGYCDTPLVVTAVRAGIAIEVRVAASE